MRLRRPIDKLSGLPDFLAQSDAENRAGQESEDAGVLIDHLR